MLQYRVLNANRKQKDTHFIVKPRGLSSYEETGISNRKSNFFSFFPRGGKREGVCLLLFLFFRGRKRERRKRGGGGKERLELHNSTQTV